MSNSVQECGRHVSRGIELPVQRLYLLTFLPHSHPSEFTANSNPLFTNTNGQSEERPWPVDFMTA
jgi:hypothetical protein